MSDVTGGSSVASSSTLNANVAFDLHDEKSTITLLRSIHQSSLSPDEKNELRDLIFSFRTTPSAQVTSELSEKFLEHGFTLSTSNVKDNKEVVEEAIVTAPVGKALNKLGTTRPSPQFGSLVKSQISQIDATSPVSQSIPAVVVEPDIPESPSIEKVAESIVPEVAVPEQTMPDVIPQMPSSPVVEAPAAERVVELETPITEVNTEESIVENEVPVVEAKPASLSSTIDTAERIKEIKREVNLLVGNPVNLIDVNNEVGREYMNALLDAMKKNNAGTPEQIARAMVRLESSFVSVKQTVASGSEIQKVDTAETDPVPPETPDVVEEVQDEPVVGQEPTTPADDSPPETEGYSAAPVIGFASVHDTHVKEKNPPTPDVPENLTVDEETMEPAVVPEVSAPAVSMPISEPIVRPIIPSVPAPAEQTVPASGIMSVAKEKQIEDLLVSQKQEAAVTDKQKLEAQVAAMDPLMTPEITNGLQQLLSEWSLFKSSGIFGTGPSGAEHPLYKKLSVLTMSAVMAGRFEGATPEIKRSISDYMNGWRYEEGILHEHTEMFDHYLRRVVKHIIDKRKSATSTNTPAQ